MSKEINLLPHKEALSGGKNAAIIIRAARLISIVMLSGVVVSVLTLFFLQQQSKIPELQKEIDSLLSVLNNQSAKIGKFMFVKNQTDSIGILLSKRTSIDKTINTIIGQVPAGVAITYLSADQQNFSLKASSNSLLIIDQFLNNMVSVINKKKLFSKINLDGVVYDPNLKTYSFSVDATL